MFRKTGINLAFKLINVLLVSKIADESIRAFVESQITPLKDVADVLTDKNPDDAAQLQQVWEEHQEQFVKDSMEVIRTIIVQNVEDQERQDLLLELVGYVEEELIKAFANA